MSSAIPTRKHRDAATVCDAHRPVCVLLARPRTSRGYASHGFPIPGDAVDQLEVQIFAGDMAGYIRLLTTRRHVERDGLEPYGQNRYYDRA